MWCDFFLTRPNFSLFYPVLFDLVDQNRNIWLLKNKEGTRSGQTQTLGPDICPAFVAFSTFNLLQLLSFNSCIRYPVNCPTCLLGNWVMWYIWFTKQPRQPAWDFLISINERMTRAPPGSALEFDLACCQVKSRQLPFNALAPATPAPWLLAQGCVRGIMWSNISRYWETLGGTRKSPQSTVGVTKMC